MLWFILPFLLVTFLTFNKSVSAQETDVVITYVNPQSPTWQASYNQWTETLHLPPNKFRDHNELLFSMRSINHYLDSFNLIHLVVANKDEIPSWLDTTHPQIHIVTHSEILDPEYLPIFNSNAIETALHHIPGLAKNFIYFNNDVFLNKPSNIKSWTPDNKSYIKYNHWRLKFNINCTFSNNNCWRQALYHDAYISKKVFDIDIKYWYAHVPHFYNRDILYQVEDTLKNYFKEVRQNRWRNRTSDLMTHLMYQSYLKAHTEIKIIDKHVKPNLLTFTVFDTKGTVDKYQQLYDRIRKTQPHFITLDDGIKNPSQEFLELHQRELCKILMNFWPWPAPWEKPNLVCEF
jgi:hypothetical protein